MGGKLSIAVLICTYKRKKELLKCLRSIKEQVRLPEHVVIIEKKTGKQSVPLKDLKLLFSTSVKITYKTIIKGNIAFSRNFAVKNSNEDIVLFVDDDVILEKGYIQKLLNFYCKNENVDSVVGKILPLKRGYWQNFIHKLLTSTIKNENLSQKVDHWPTLNFSFRRKCFQKVKYDESFSALEDIDFCLNLRSMGYNIWYIPQMLVFHSYRNSFIKFCRTFYFYYKNNMINLAMKHPNYDLLPLYLFSVKAKNNFVFFLKTIKRILLISRRLRKDFNLSLCYYFACFIYYIVFYISVDKQYIKQLN